MREWSEALVLVLAAVGLLAFGRWGRSQAPQLVPAHLTGADRARREGTLRRGGFACQVAAGVLLVLAVLAVL